MTDHKHMAEIGGPKDRERVAAYVTRRREGRRELLVFDPEGVDWETQVPAGRVAAGEQAEQTLLREVAEESGVIHVRVKRLLGSQEWRNPKRGSLHRTRYYELEIDDELEPHAGDDAWDHVVTGGGEDEGRVFRCRWAPLPLTVPLWADQGEFLGQLP